MEGRAAIPLVLLCGALVVLGLAWGAATQKETFIGNQLTEDPAVGSDVTILTAFVSGLGVVSLTMLLGRAAMGRRTGAALAAGGCSWLLLFLVQGGWPNYVVLREYGQASMLQSNLLLESFGSPSVMLPVIAIGILLLLGLGWALHRARVLPPGVEGLDAMRRDHLGLTALAIPVLLVGAAGMLRVMIETPSRAAGAGLITILHPLAAAACVLLSVTITLRAVQFARLRRDPDRTWPVMEAWRTFDRIDLAAIVTLALMAALSSFLPGDDSPGVVSAGPTLLFTLRSHGQSVIFLAAVLLPMQLVHRRIGGRLHTARDDPEGEDEHTLASTSALLAVVLAASLSGVIVTLAVDRALVPWVVALVPSGIAATIVARPFASALVRITAAWCMWGIGNTVQGVYIENSFPELDYAVAPGILALWRMGAAILIAWIVYDLLADLGRAERPWVRVPMSLAGAFGTALVLLLLFPLNIWAVSAVEGDLVAIGSLYSSQQTGVKVVMLFLAFLSGLGATAVTARLVRPEWFRRTRGQATTDTRRVVTPG